VLANARRKGASSTANSQAGGFRGPSRRTSWMPEGGRGILAPYGAELPCGQFYYFWRGHLGVELF
jgi:hypothetical protein